MNKLNLIGQKFGRLMVISEAPKQKRCIQWNCLCDCGAKTIVSTSNLRAGYTKSCGCLHLEIISLRNGTHHQTKTRLFHIWMGMKARCQNPNSPAWENYGGRGIRVCGEWLSNFESFAKWAKAHGYDDSLSLDRINVNGNYDPSNCRWTTARQQARNTRKNVFYKGRCLADWCNELGISNRTVDRRLHRGHWTIEKALFTPVRHKNCKTTEQNDTL